MSSEELQGWFVRDARVNGGIVWVLAALLVVAAVVAILDGAVPSAALALVAAAVAVVPAVVHRSWRVAVPWPLLLLASLPLWLGAARPSLQRVFVTGISVAALAMLVVVVLQMTTRVRLTPRFAVFFVTIATLATAGWWAVLGAASVRFFGNPFLETNDELMAVFTAAAVGGFVAGGVFFVYFNRRLRENVERRSGGEAT